MPRGNDAFDAKILIVDDQDSNLRLLELVLGQGGYTAVSTTNDPAGVCGLHRLNHYDLILLDLRMPRMNGFEVMEGLAQIGGGGKVPVLLLSADPSQIVQVFEAGAAGFLSKPFDFAEVLRSVRLILKKKKTTTTSPTAA